MTCPHCDHSPVEAKPARDDPHSEADVGCTACGHGPTGTVMGRSSSVTETIVPESVVVSADQAGRALARSPAFLFAALDSLGRSLAIWATIGSATAQWRVAAKTRSRQERLRLRFVLTTLLQSLEDDAKPTPTEAETAALEVAKTRGDYRLICDGNEEMAEVFLREVFDERRIQAADAWFAAKGCKALL